MYQNNNRFLLSRTLLLSDFCFVKSFLKLLRFLLSCTLMHSDLLSYTKNYSISFYFFDLVAFVIGLGNLLLIETSSLSLDINRTPTRYFSTSFALVFTWFFNQKPFAILNQFSVKYRLSMYQWMFVCNQ